MNRQFKVGDIVQDGTHVSSIESIEGEFAILARNYEVKLDKLSPVEIRGGFDNRIVLKSIIPVRAPIVSPGQNVPIRKPKCYIESGIDKKDIASIVDTNGFEYIHELQDWIAQNAPDYFLCKEI